MTILAPDLLRDRRLAWGGGQSFAGALAALGAWTATITGGREQAAAEWVEANVPLHGLVHDARLQFGGGPDAVQATLADAWIVARAVAAGALIEGGEGGRLLFVAPAPGAGPYAQAARAAFENLARTLSVEWARFGITAVAIWPGDDTPEQALAELVCFLVSDAGAYFSGCRFEFGAAAFIPGS